MVARNHRGARNADAERRPANSKWLEQEEDRTDGRRRMGSTGREYGIIFVARSH